MPKIQLDIAHDCPKSDIENACHTYQVQATLIKEFGPAGGNPLYEFDGPRDNLIEFLKFYTAGQDLEYYISRIKL